ncbi:hypothetical protein BHE74_00011037 [Ensete ventricosum]|nr:hypothetical protein BHE74_00011037 [Ensete ventricosum]
MLEVLWSSPKEIGSSSITHQKFTGKFIRSSPTGCRELAERMLGVRRRKSGAR